MIEREVMELRGRVGELERAVQFLARHVGVTIPAALPPAGVSEHVATLVRQGNKLGAIMAHQKETGVDLATAKALIEGIR